MNRKQLLLLLVVLAIVGSAGLVLLRRTRESWTVLEAKMGDKVLPNFHFNDVAAIHIKGSAELHVVRKNGVWRVQERGDYPADFHLISDQLVKVRDLKVVQAETVGPSQLGRVELEEPGTGLNGGTLVEFNDAQGKLLDSLLLGKKHIREQNDAKAGPFNGVGAPDGRYIISRSDPKDVLLVSNALTSFEPIPGIWSSKEFFKPGKLKSLALVSTNATDSWKLVRESESSPWRLLEPRPGETLDTNKINLTTSSLAYPAFTDIAAEADPIKTGLDKPLVLNLETFDHFTYSIRIGAKGPDQTYYFTVSASADIPAGSNEKADKALQDKLKLEQGLASWVYLVSSWLVEPAILPRAQLMESKEAASPVSTTKDESKGISGVPTNSLSEGIILRGN